MKEIIIKTIYLDQNILSDLRNRKLKETDNDCFILFKRIILESDIIIVYSYITLLEINQIPDNKYKKEHIDLLEEFDAIYIEPKSKQLSNKRPNQVWKDYLESLTSQYDSLNLKNIELNMDQFVRKGSGLPVDSSFEEIGSILETSIKGLLNEATDLLNMDFNEENLKDKKNANQAKYLISKIKADLPKLLSNIEPIKDEFKRLDYLPLGPKSFREYKPINDLNISELDSSEVVIAIENVFNKENPTSKWRDDSNDRLEDKISIAYSLMNWAGYYPDDFDKIKIKKDRFRASSNDMQHVVMAARSDFLISNDFKFCMKGIASYKYAGSSTRVFSLEDFLNEYTKRI